MSVVIELVKDTPLPSVDKISDLLKNPACGAISSFVGNASLMKEPSRHHKEQLQREESEDSFLRVL